MKFIVVTRPAAHNSAGFRVMHQLNDMLNQLGQTSKLGLQIPYGNSTTVTDEIREFYSKNPDAIFIMFESVAMNIPGNPRIVRYVAYEVGKAPNVSPTINPRELVICYNKDLCASATKAVGRPVTEDHVIHINCLEPSLFFDHGKPELRINDCLYLGKGLHKRPLIIPKFPADVEKIRYITPFDPPTHALTAKLLRRTKRLFSLDGYSAIETEAYICGAEVYVAEGDKWERRIPTQEMLNMKFGDLEPVRKLIRLCEERWGK